MIFLKIMGKKREHHSYRTEAVHEPNEETQEERKRMTVEAAAAATTRHTKPCKTIRTTI